MYLARNVRLSPTPLKLEKLIELDLLSKEMDEQKSILIKIDILKRILSILIIKKRIFIWDIWRFLKPAINAHGFNAADKKNAKPEKVGNTIGNICNFIGIHSHCLPDDICRTMNVAQANDFIILLLQRELQQKSFAFELKTNPAALGKKLNHERARIQTLEFEQSIPDDPEDIISDAKEMGENFTVDEF